MRGSTSSIVRTGRSLWLVLCAASLFTPIAWGQTEYRSAREAYTDGARLYKARKFDECRAPFEAALELSDDVELKIKIYRALLQSYRQLAEIDKMLEATDFLFEHVDNATEKSLVARSLASFAYQRGKAPQIVELYEAKLKQDPRHKPALYTLTEIYRRVEPNAGRRAELLEVLSQVETADARLQAEEFEQLAAAQPDLAAWNWKEAAAAWLLAGDKIRAMQAAKLADAAGPERRSDLLAHFWHKALGDVYLQVDDPREAVVHYEQAMKSTNIAGYIEACQAQLAKARGRSFGVARR